MRDLNYPHFFFFRMSSCCFLKIIFLCSSIFLCSLNSSSSNAVKLATLNTPPQILPSQTNPPTTLPLPEGIKPPSSELPDFQYTSDNSSQDVKYNPETRDAIRNDAHPL